MGTMTNDSNHPTAPLDPEADPRLGLFRALDAVTVAIDQLDVADLDRPTPCAEYDVADLAGHLVGVGRRISALGRGEDGNAVSLEVDDVAADGWAGAWRSEADRIRSAWASDEILTTMLALPWAELPGAAAAGIYAAELLVHSWDLAVSIDATVDWAAPDLAPVAAAALAPMRMGLPADERGPGAPFDPVVPLPDDAPPIERLVAWVGRDPSRWTAASR